MKEKPIAFYAEIARELGSINAALFYQQIRYWSDKGSRQDGWIYKSASDFESETALTEYEQRTCRDILVKKEWIEVKKMKVNGAPTWHYRMLMDFKFQFFRTVDSTVPTLKNHSSETEETTVPLYREYTETTAKEQSSFSPTPATVKEFDFGSDGKLQKASDYQPDYQPPKRKAGKKTPTEKQRAAFNAMRSITYYREKADESEMTYFAEEDESANRRYQAQAKEFEKRYRNNWKDVIDWWWAGEGEWANFHPSNFFSISTYMKFDNRNKGGKKKGGELPWMK